MLVGAQLRRLRTQAGLTREQAAEAIRASAWKLHRLENGQVSFKERDIADLLALYGVTDADQVTTLIDLAREANAPSWWSRYSDLLPPWVRAYIDLESAASLIRTYQDQLVPGLLQTEDYRRAPWRRRRGHGTPGGAADGPAGAAGADRRVPAVGGGGGGGTAAAGRRPEGAACPA